MAFSLSRGKALEVGRYGIEWAQLPPLDTGPLDLHAWFAADARQGAGGRDQGSGPAGRGAAGQVAATAEFAPEAPAADHRPSGMSPPPLELEIGSGKGTFLVQQAAQTPDVRYIGIEWARAFWRYAADRCRRNGLANVRLVHGEAGAFVRNYVPDGCLRQVHIYFPDPWPKARHHKRRLIQAPFLRELHRVLEPGGRIRLATDHDDYFQWMQDHAAQVTDLFDRLPFASPESAGEGELVGTNFERKYRREGRPFHAMILKKRQDKR